MADVYRQFLPSTLYYVKTFQASERLIAEGDGGFRIEHLTDDLELQIEKWVNATKSLIVSTGPLSVEFQPSGTAGTGGVFWRMVAVTYAPAIRQGMETYGKKTEQLGEVPGPVTGDNPEAAAEHQPEDVPDAESKTKLRVPDLSGIVDGRGAGGS